MMSPRYDLKGLAAQTKLAKEKALSKAENLMLEKAATGELADCSTIDDKGHDPKEADGWTAERQIRAELVAWLCMNEQARRQVNQQGIQVYGADIAGPIDLSFVTIPFQLMLNNCRLKEDIDLGRAEVSQLDLEGSLVKGIGADGLIVKNDVFLRKGFTSTGEVRLPGAQIGGDLDCSGGTFTNPLRKDAEGKDIEGSGDALNADRIKVKGDVFLRQDKNAEGKQTRFSAKGEVNLLDAQIDGQLSCSGGIFTKPGGNALIANRTIVKSSVFLSDGFTAEGRVYLEGAQVGGDLDCRDGNFQKASLDLRDASTGTLYDSGLNDLPRGKTADYPPTLWPPGGKNKDHQLLLDGFTYGRISSQGHINVDNRLGWLGRQPQSPFLPRSYLLLAKILRDSGDSKGALRALEKMEDLRRSDEKRGAKVGLWGLLREWVARFWSFLLKWTIGYGYHPERAVWALIFLVVLGWFVYGESYPAGRIAPTEKEAYAEFKKPGGKLPAQYPIFSPAIYSLENSLPLVKLDQAVKWQPDPAATWPPWVLWFLRLQILLGWVLATFFVAGVSGIVHKE